MSADTYYRVYDGTTNIDCAPEVINGTGVSDVLKASNLYGTVISNKTFIGAPGENDIDLCRGSDAVIGPNVHRSRPGVANITAKGGFQRLHLRGKFGTLEWGQFSIYDKWFALPPSSGLTFDLNAAGVVTVWRGEVPADAPAAVTIKRIHPLIVWGYFVWRSLQMTFGRKG